MMMMMKPGPERLTIFASLKIVLIFFKLYLFYFFFMCDVFSLTIEFFEFRMKHSVNRVVVFLPFRKKAGWLH